jgi:sugar phosphate isomerase/epimerase
MIKILTQDKDFFPVDFKKKFIYLKEMGFDGFEIDGKQLLGNFENIQQASTETNFPVHTACGGYAGWIGDFDENKRKQGLKDICNILEKLAAIGGKGIVIPAAWGMFSLRLPPMVPPRTAEKDDEIMFDSLNILNDCAKKNGVFVFLEPLNRYEDHMINTVKKAFFYTERFSNVKIIADFYHMNIEEANIQESLIEYQQHIHHIHLADSHRFQPGSGHIDFEKGFQTLKQIKYQGAVAFECRVLGDNPEKSYKEALLFIKSLLQ